MSNITVGARPVEITESIKDGLVKGKVIGLLVELQNCELQGRRWMLDITAGWTWDVGRWTELQLQGKACEVVGVKGEERLQQRTANWNCRERRVRW
ncbi:hypothetical protein [Desulfosediminicola ganghwensis]|uniref:hypothetical protein n=1 Tax=Desulfosediminicola ganghwensis TaxID=2569540 RepID=UPI0010AD4A52|nr:hypothetical protein [Desulfosediminicola ganghwensis]